MLREWDQKFPGRLENMFSALQNVVPSHLMDRALHPFQTLRATGVPDEDGDKAFDDEPLPVPQRPLTEDSDPGEAGQAPRPAGNETVRRAVIPIAVS
jgi:tRNA 2-thiocytidine biosynthesis protein TtcA